jgi:hypothetical protein
MQPRYERTMFNFCFFECLPPRLETRLPSLLFIHIFLLISRLFVRTTKHHLLDGCCDAVPHVKTSKCRHRQMRSVSKDLDASRSHLASDVRAFPHKTLRFHGNRPLMCRFHQRADDKPISAAMKFFFLEKLFRLLTAKLRRRS